MFEIHYDIEKGIQADDPEHMNHWLVRYGFTPIQFVPSLNKFQYKSGDHRKLVGSTFWVAGTIYGFHNAILLLEGPGSAGFLRAGQQKAMVFLNRPYPVSPFGVVLRGAMWASVGILAYDFYAPKVKQHFSDFLSSLNPLNYNPYLA